MESSDRWMGDQQRGPARMDLLLEVPNFQDMLDGRKQG